jgi:outer membrane protein OmpA-like peptidoglycan-associated protein
LAPKPVNLFGKTVDLSRIAKQFLLALQIRRVVMRKPVVGVVAVVCAVAGVAACGKSEKTKEQTPAAPLSGVTTESVYKVQKVADVKPVAASGASERASNPGLVVNTDKLPKFTLELGEGKSGFKFRSALLSEEAKAKIDEMFTGDKVELKDAHFEIEGYTDNLGSKEVNIQMAIARAKAVKEYLVEQHEFPADCINVVGFGSENPVGDNSTPEGRARNRRVVIKVVD